MKVNCIQGSASCELSDVVFGAKFSKALLHQTVTSFASSTRRNIASAKTRGEVRGHARKPWRQKGTGRARAGSSKGPLWRGGGVTFASGKPNWQRKINRKAWRACLRIILSQLLREERLRVVEQAYEGEAKTRLLQQWRIEMGLVDQSTLLVVEQLQVPKHIVLAARNLPDFDVCMRHEINPVILMSYDQVVITAATAEQLNEGLV